MKETAWAVLPQFLSLIYNEILKKILSVNYVFERLPQLLMWQRDTQVMQLLCHANLSYAKFWISDGLHVIKGRTVTSEMLWSKFPLKHPRTCWSPAELTAIFQWRKHWNTELSQTEDRHKSNAFLKKFPHHFLKLHLRFSIRKSPANFCLILNPSLFFASEAITRSVLVC